MGLLNKLKDKLSSEGKTDVEIIKNAVEDSIVNDICTIKNYVISDFKDNLENKKTISVDLSKIDELNLGPCGKCVVSAIRSIPNLNNGDKADNKGQVKQLNFNSKEKNLTDVNTYCKEARLKVGPMNINPTMVMMAVAFAKIEADLKKIEEIGKEILSFLVNDKESEIEADLETLNRMINEFKFNYEDSQYLANGHKMVMDIKRTSNKNINFYKKQIISILNKDKKIITNQSMNSLQTDLENNLEYYKMSMYIYAFSTFLEIMLLGNYNSEYLVSKKNEIVEFNNDYIKVCDDTLEYITKLSDKSIEGNLISGLGNAEKAISNLANKVDIIKEKNLGNWLSNQGDNLKQKGQNIKDNFMERFKEIKELSSVQFISKIEEISVIYNNTKNIYFDDLKIYLEVNE